MAIKNSLNQKLLFFAFSLIIAQSQLFAQGHSQNNWYFGNANLGVVFGKGENDTPETVNANRNDPSSFGMNGGAVATNPVSGKMLFYTNGVEVFDATHRIMPNGSSLSGDPAKNQSTVIFPVKDHPLKYYILTLNPSGALHYSIVDMELSGNGNGNNNPLNLPLGNVTVLNQTVATVPPSNVIKLITIGTNDHFLIVQNNTSNAVLSYRIEMEAGTDPDDGSILDFDPDDIAFVQEGQMNNLPASYTIRNLSYSPESGKIAFTAIETGRNVWVADFNASNGTFSNDSAFFNSGSVNEIIYDVAWSGDGTKLYFSRYEEGAAPPTGNILRYDYASGSSSYSPVLANPFQTVYGLQKGPDGKIYHLYQESDGGPYLMGRVNEPHAHIDSLEYESPIFDSQDFQAMQFPQAAPSPDVEVQGDFTWYPVNAVSPNQACQNAEIHFIPEIEPAADSLHWDFGDGNSSNEYAPRHTYENPGQYTIEVTAFLNGQSQQLTPKVIDITMFELEADAQDTTACEFPIVYDKLQVEGTYDEIEWSTGETGTDQITIQEPGNYWVIVRQGGCETYAAFAARLYGNESQVSNVWYFGNGAGLDFTPDENKSGEPPYPLTDGVMDAPQGTSTISDPNGKLLFYTDGHTVWNKNHQVMQNGNDIGGDPGSTQSAIIVPFPEDPSMFYIFTTQAAGAGGAHSLKYSIVDMKQEFSPGTGFLGAVVEKDHILFTGSTERITATGLQGGGNVWLVAHEYGTNAFRSYLISENGISNPVLSSAGQAHSDFSLEQAQGYMKLAGNGSRLAVAIQPNIVQIFDVDTTGTVSNPITINVGGSAVYGLEFSASASKLFVSTTNDGIFEYYIAKDSVDTYEELGVIDGTAGLSLGAVQVAPNGQIMVAINGSGYLGAIIPNEEREEKSTFNEQGADLGGKTSTLGLPNFIQSIMEPPMDPTMMVSEACVDNEVTFSGTGSSDIDKFEWAVFKVEGATRTQIGIANATEQETSHTFAEGGIYEVTLRVYNECGFDTLMTQNIEVFPAPDLSGLPEVVVLCDGGIDLGDELPEGEGYTYLWSGGATPEERINHVTQSGTYTVIVTNANGCSEEAEIFVGPPFEGVDLGDDRFVCKDDELRLDAGVNANVFEWYVDDVRLNTGATQRTVLVNTAIPGSYTYRVRVQDPVDDDCWITDEVEVTVSGFDITLVNTENSDQCDDASANGSIEISVSPANGDYTISWFGPGGELAQFENQLSANGLAGGVYSVTVTDNLTGCSETENGININEPANFEITTISINDDGCGEGTIEVTLDTSIDGTYRFLDHNNTVAQSGNIVSDNQITLNYDLPEDGPLTYVIEITSDDGCTLTEPVNLQSGNPTAEALVDPLIVGCNFIQLYNAVHIPETDEVEVVFYYDEAGTLGMGNVANNVTQAIIDQQIANYGNSIFWAIARRNETDGTYTVDWCPSEAFPVQATILPTPQVSIDVNDDAACDGTITLTAVIDNLDNRTYADYAFTWSNGSTSRSITVTSPGSHNYTVSARYQTLPGCDGAASEDIEVPEPLVLQLTANPACDDDSEILITSEHNGSNLAYQWYRGNDPVGTNSPTYQVITTDDDNGNGTYRLVATTTSGCERESSIYISRTPIQRGNLGERVEICADEGTTVELNPGNFSSYEWVLPNGSTSNAPVITADMPGIYTVRLGTAGCYDEQEILVEEVCEARIQVPNAFRPGSNIEINKAFVVFANDYVTDFSIFIYNRWGELIYQSDNINFQWNGTFRGREAPAGTYAYVIRYRSANIANAPEKSLRGGVVLLR